MLTGVWGKCFSPNYSLYVRGTSLFKWHYFKFLQVTGSNLIISIDKIVLYVFFFPSYSLCLIHVIRIIDEKAIQTSKIIKCSNLNSCRQCRIEP